MQTQTAPSLLIIGYVWPEPRSSAAGVRTEQLLKAIQDAGWRLTIASSSKENEAFGELEARGIQCVRILLNDSSFNHWIKAEQFDFILFDRFVTEEQFGWRVAEACPGATRVLDTCDLHFLRRTRQAALTDGASLDDIFTDRLDFTSDDTYREIASIYRCDLSLFVSNHEVELLEARFEVPAHLLKVLPIGYSSACDGLPEAAFEERSQFATIGNFRHPPNADGNRWLKKEIWPLIRAALPHAEMHVYGAYPAKADMELTDARQGFFVEGPVPDSLEALRKHRVILAPLRFGAGIKGKIADAWRSGAPVVTTPIGAEGMRLGQEFGGRVAASAEDFAREAVRLHEDSKLWQETRDVGLQTLRERLNGEQLNAEFMQALSELRAPSVPRPKNFVTRMLAQQAFQGTKYFSKWIETKALLAAQVDAVKERANEDGVGAAP